MYAIGCFLVFKICLEGVISNYQLPIFDYKLSDYRLPMVVMVKIKKLYHQLLFFCLFERSRERFKEELSL